MRCAGDGVYILFDGTGQRPGMNWKVRDVILYKPIYDVLYFFFWGVGERCRREYTSGDIES